MDTDLAFCLGQFIDDQVQLIDDRLEKIQHEEMEKCRKLEEEKLVHNRKKPPPKNKGSHHDDQSLVDQFIQELRETSQTTHTKTIIDDQSCIDTLRAEASTKVNACAKYVSRIRNLAQPLPNTTNFVKACNEAIDYLQRPQEFEGNFKTLFVILEESDANNVLQKVQQWWKDAYGSMIADLNRRNQKINPAISDNSFAVLSQTNRVIDNARKLIAARKIIAVEPPTRDIIRKFVRRLLTLDEEQRQRINPEELINQLNDRNIEQIIEYAQRWLAKRDEVRNQKEEEDPFDIQIEEIKAEYGRRRIAQEAKKLALAALLCRLAVGSNNGDQFDQQLKKTVHKQKDKNGQSLPVISGDIKEPEAEELPVLFQLEVDSADMDRWESNTDGIRERFGSGLCQAFRIPDKNIRVNQVDRNKGIIFLIVSPPYGKNVVDSLNGSASDAVARMEAVRKCCHDLNANVESITLGELGLKVEDRLMDPRWNKIYGWSRDISGEEFWPNPINQGGKPYYCPSGWKRFGIKVAENSQEFDARWGNWYCAYHGTRGENASKILTSGLKVSTEGCFYGEGIPRVYVSPSIEYCGHPRYARPWKQTKRNGQTCWYQLVFQCRVNPASIKTIGPETLIPSEYKQKVRVDTNFDNGELEWIILGREGDQFIKKDIICYGLMMRISNVDPKTLEPAAWWKYSLYGDQY